MSLTALEEENWKGVIPVEFSLADVEVDLRPPPLFLLVARQSSVVFSLPVLRTHFAPYLAPGGDWWLEHNRVPLRWMLPFGVVYDTFVAAASIENPSSTPPLPFRVSLRVSVFPEKVSRFVQAFPEGTDPAPLWLQVVKGAVAARWGSITPFMNLTTSETKIVSRAAHSAALDDFRDARDAIVRAARDPPRAVPVKLVVDTLRGMFDLNKIEDAVQVHTLAVVTPECTTPPLPSKGVPLAGLVPVVGGEKVATLRDMLKKAAPHAVDGEVWWRREEAIQDGHSTWGWARVWISFVYAVHFVFPI